MTTSPFTPTHCTCHCLGRPITIAPSENGVGKHHGMDDTCVAVKSTPLFFNASGNVKRLGKRRDWRWNEDAGLNEAARIPPLSPSFLHSELIRTAAPRRSSENSTAVFAVPTLRAHSHSSTQTKTVIIPPPSSLCPHIHNGTVGGGVIPNALITVPIRFIYAIL